MKMKKMVGAFALTAALAMGTAPAFATTGDDLSKFDKDSEGNTTIKAHVEKALDPQIQATVPLQLVVAFGSSGTTEIVAPSDGAYKITNTGEDAIQVVDVKLEAINSTTFIYDGVNVTDGYIYNGGTSTAADSTKNYLMFTYETAGNKAFLSPDHALSKSLAKAGPTNNDDYYLSGAKTFVKDKIQPQADLPITIGGTAYLTETPISLDETTDTLCKLIYTIEAADAA